MECLTTPPSGLVSVVVPVFDEAPRLARSLARLTGRLAALGLPFEVVCVDDGSRDGSRAILARAAEADARIAVIGWDENRGEGAAVRAGRARRIARAS